MEPGNFQSEVLAQETHAGRIWSLLILLALTRASSFGGAFIHRPRRAAALVVIAVVGLGSLALVWSGFQYRFLRAWG